MAAMLLALAASAPDRVVRVAAGTAASALAVRQQRTRVAVAVVVAVTEALVPAALAAPAS